MSPWLEALEKEAAFCQDRFGVFDTLYLGGGTPSLLTAGQMAHLLNSLRRRFAFSPNTEVTLEANPDDLNQMKIGAYRDLGVNRLSVGVQSFHDRELAFLGRRHNTRQTVEALEAARAAGFANLSLDLIYGLPGQSLEGWRKTLEQALAFHPEHLSCYQLTYEPGTPLGRRKARGEVIPATEEEERDFFLFTSRFLEDHDYLHYEISNFARQKGRLGQAPVINPKDATPTLTLPPQGGGDSAVASLPHNVQFTANDAQFLANEEFCPRLINNQGSFNRKPKTENRKPYFSRHNRKYWRHIPYLGLGPGAHSFQEGVRWWNVASVPQYCQSLARGEAPLADREILSPEQLRLEALYLGLRTREGAPLDLLRQTRGWEKTLTNLQKSGLVEMRRDRAVPTLEGFLMADSLPLYFMDADMGKDMAVTRETPLLLAPDP
ncbi:MAG: coproporphyrinogen III oxidase family protein [Deltaproteobacteria bacterium]|nr:MAG: coproporphyrinogen III oxidase family protein [Deltaproteobacteria bacterium]